MIPSGWHEQNLSDVTEVKIGGTPSRSIEAYWHNASDKSDAYPWVSISDLNNDPVVTTKETITSNGVQKSNVKLVKAGTVMMSFKLTIGRIARAGTDLYTNEAIAAFIPKNESVISDYLYYILPQAANSGEIDQAVKGKTLNKEKILNLSLLLPPLPEQKRIAEVLGSVDAAIEATRAVIEQTKKVKQGLLQTLLTQGIGHTKFKDSPLGKIPESWEVKKVEEIAQVIRGASPRPKGDPRYYGGNVPRLMVSDVTRDGKYVTPTTDYLTAEGAKLSRPMPAGTLTIVCSGTVGIPSFLAIDACIHDGFLALKEVSKETNTEYLYYAFSILRERFERGATHGGVFTNLTTEILKQFEISIPPLKEQSAIVEKASAIDDQLNIEMSNLAALQQLKKGLMHDLLTGKVRVA